MKKPFYKTLNRVYSHFREMMGWRDATSPGKKALASAAKRKSKTIPKGLFSFAEISLLQKLLNLQAER